MTNVNPDNGNETKSNIFPLDIFKSDVIHSFIKKIKVFEWFSKSKFLSFMTEVNPNNENETKSDIFHGTYSNLTSFYIGHKMLKYFKDFYSWNFSILLQKRPQTGKMK